MIGALSKADLHLLRVFEAVAETGGFSSAEVRLNVSASTISRQISGLETRLGVTLCERGRGGFRLTQEGETVLHASKRLFTAVSDFDGAVSAVKGELSGQVAIASIENWVTDRERPPATSRWLQVTAQSRIGPPFGGLVPRFEVSVPDAFSSV